MSIWNILAQHITHPTGTRRPDDRVPYPADYRGELEHDPSVCIGCGICSYVCSPGTIRLDRSRP